MSFGPSPCDTQIPSVFTRVAGFRLFVFSTKPKPKSTQKMKKMKNLVEFCRDWIEKTVEQNGGWEQLLVPRPDGSMSIKL